MSFDLAMCQKPCDVKKAREALMYLAQVPYMEPARPYWDGLATTFAYDNPETNTYCIIVHKEPDYKVDDPCGIMRYRRFELEMSWAHTAQEALPAMMIAIELQNRFNMMIKNWQDIGQLPGIYTLEELMSSWSIAGGLFGKIMDTMGDRARRAGR